MSFSASDSYEALPSQQWSSIRPILVWNFHLSSPIPTCPHQDRAFEVEFMAVAAIFNRRLDAIPTWPLGWRGAWCRKHRAEIEPVATSARQNTPRIA